MKRWPLIVALALTTAFAVYFSWFDIVRHHKTNSSRFDLGNVEQVEWNFVHGRGFTETDPYGTATVSRLAFHGDVFLVLIAPLYAFVPRTETLLFLQALFVASGALAAFINLVDITDLNVQFRKKAMRLGYKFWNQVETFYADLRESSMDLVQQKSFAGSYFQQIRWMGTGNRAHKLSLKRPQPHFT